MRRHRGDVRWRRVRPPRPPIRVHRAGARRVCRRRRPESDGAGWLLCRSALREDVRELRVEVEVTVFGAGGTAASVRLRNDSRARAGASSRASPSGELRAMQTTPWPWLREGQTLTSPVPVGRCSPSARRSRAKTHSTVSSAPVWKVACTAYGSAVSYRRPAGTGSEDSLDTTRRRCSSQLTVVFISAMAFRSVCARGFARRRNRHPTYRAVVNPSVRFRAHWVPRLAVSNRRLWVDSGNPHSPLVG